MHDDLPDRRRIHPLRAAAIATAPPLRLAGVDDDGTAEPHIVRGID